MGGSRGRQGSERPLENHVAICFLKNTGTDPPREAIGHLWSNCFSMEVSMALCEIHEWLKSFQDPSDGFFSGSVHNPVFCDLVLYVIIILSL